MVCAACGGEPEAGGGKTRPEEPPAAARLRERILEEIRASAAAAPIVVDDETVREEVPEKPGPGAILCYFRGASAQVPTPGLRAVRITLSREGLAVELGCEDSEALVLDRSGSPAAKEAQQRLFSRGIGLRERIWPAGPPEAERPLHRELGRAESRYRSRFDPKEAEGLQLTRSALRARSGADPADELADLFSLWQLLEVKRGIVAELVETGTPVLTPLAAGPTLGIVVGVPGRDPEVSARVEGPDGMLLRVRIRGLEGQPVPGRWRGFIAAFRPFATNDLPASHFERDAPSTSGPVAALNALSALLLGPNVDRGLRLLSALREAAPSGTDPEALPRLALELASQLQFSEPDSRRLETAARGD